MTGKYCTFFFQTEDGIRAAQESRGLGDVYKRQVTLCDETGAGAGAFPLRTPDNRRFRRRYIMKKFVVGTVSALALLGLAALSLIHI